MKSANSLCIERAVSMLWTSVLWSSAWGCQHGGVPESMAPRCTDLQMPCSQTHRHLWQRGYAPLAQASARWQHAFDREERNAASPGDWGGLGGFAHRKLL